MDKPRVIAQAVQGFRQAQRSLNQAGQSTLALGQAAALDGLLDALTALPGAALFAPLKASSRLQTGVAEAEQASLAAAKAAQAQFIDDLLQGARRVGGVSLSGMASGPGSAKPKVPSVAKGLGASGAALAPLAPRVPRGAVQQGSWLGALGDGALRDGALQEAEASALPSLARAPVRASPSQAVAGAGPDSTAHPVSDLLASLTAQLAGQAAGATGVDLLGGLLGLPADASLRGAVKPPANAAFGASGADANALRGNAADAGLGQLVQDVSGAALLSEAVGAVGGGVGGANGTGQALPGQDPTAALLGMSLLTHMVSDWWPMTQGVGASMGALDATAGALAGALQRPYRSGAGTAGQGSSASTTAPSNATPRSTAARASSRLKPQRAAPANTLAALRLNESANDATAAAVSPGASAVPQAASPARTGPDDEALADQLNRALVEQAWRAGVDLT